MRKPKPWVLWLPKSFHANPLGMMVSVLFSLVGLVYALGGAKEGSVAQLLNSPLWVRTWGASLFLSCVVLGLGIHKASLETEKLGCRLMSLSAGLFGVWVALGVGLRGIATVVLVILLAFFLQLRIGVIKQLQNPWVPPKEVAEDEP